MFYSDSDWRVSPGHCLASEGARNKRKSKISQSKLY